MPFVNQIKFGSDGTAPTIYQTALLAPITGAVKILPAAPTISADGLQATFGVVFDANELNDTVIREAALVAADGTTIARAPTGEYRKLTGIYFEFYWTIGYAD